MTGAAGPEQSSYDVVVIGAGLGGLSAGSFIARAGRSVLVVERADGPGGLTRSFQRGEYTFDPAIHIIAPGTKQLLIKMLDLLEVADMCDFVQLPEFYGVSFPEKQLRMPHGLDAFIDATAAAAGVDERDGMHRFFEMAAQVHREVHQLPPQLGLNELGDAVERFPTLFRYHDATLEDALSAFVEDERVRTLFTASWPFFGLPPSRLSFFSWSTPFLTLASDGPFLSIGGASRLGAAMAAALDRHGGELVVNTPVEQVVVEDGKVAGVRLGSGHEIRAEAVVSNIDARTTLEQLVGVEHLPRPYLMRLARMRPSLSGVVLYAATDADVTADGLATQEFIFDTSDHDEAFARLETGSPAAAWLNTPTIHDRSLAPDGHHILILTVLAPYEIDGGWSAQADAYRERLIGLLEQRVPSLRGRLTHAELATPPVFQRFTGGTAGAIYGWDATPNQSGSRRLSRFTPVGGLFLAGHWTQPGMGAIRTVYSGIEAAMAVAGTGYAEAFLRDLELVP